MKNFLFYRLLLLVFTACAGQESTSGDETMATETATIYQRVDQETFRAKLADPNVVLLDVRTPGETDRGMIDGAVLINYNSPDFNKKIAALDKEKTYLVYCQSGGRSGKACNLMQGMGFKEIYELETGYGSWE